MRKSINFDLSTEALKKHYPSKHYRNGYGDIKKFLLNNGFKHRQWSGYVSVQDITNAEINKIIAEMTKELPWIKKCVNRFDVTNVGKPYDITHLITGKEPMPKKIAQTKEEKPKPFTIGKKSILSAKSRNQNTQQKQPTKKKEHSLE